MEQNPYIFRRR